MPCIVGTGEPSQCSHHSCQLMTHQYQVFVELARNIEGTSQEGPVHGAYCVWLGDERRSTKLVSSQGLQVGFRCVHITTSFFAPEGILERQLLIQKLWTWTVLICKSVKICKCDCCASNRNVYGLVKIILEMCSNLAITDTIGGARALYRSGWCNPTNNAIWGMVGQEVASLRAIVTQKVRAKADSHLGAQPDLRPRETLQTTV